MIITPVRSRQVADKIVENGFQKSEFTFTPTHEARFKLVFKPNEHFQIDFNEKGHSFARPGPNGNMSFTREFKTWENVLDLLSEWLKILKENIEIGNPWEENNTSYQNIFTENVEEKMSRFESDFVNEKLDIILEALSTMDISINEIKEDLDYLKNSSNKVSKKDWQIMFHGSFFGWMLSNAIPSDSSKKIWEMIMNEFNSGKLLQ